jgi:hypothetical protein
MIGNTIFVLKEWLQEILENNAAVIRINKIDMPGIEIY